jgi:ribonuclease HII
MFKEEKLTYLRELGVKDSKMVLQNKRVELAKEITRLSEGIKVIEVFADEIDRAVNGVDELNLNWLEAIKQAEIINELKPDRAVIDCPSTNVQAYSAYLKKHIDKNLRDKIELIVQHKADQNFVECSSASIMAKVSREAYIAQIKKKLNIDFGSGYPSDPKTKAFIEKYHDHKVYQHLFRKSWETYKKISREKGQKGLGEF